MSGARTKSTKERTAQEGRRIALAGMTIFSGPSLLSRLPVVYLRLNGEAAQKPDLAALKSLEARLLAVLRKQSAVTADRLVPAFPGDNATNPDRSVELPGPHDLSGLSAWLAVQLQRLLDFDAELWRELPSQSLGRTAAVFEYQDAVIADLAGRAAVDLVAAGLGESGEQAGIEARLVEFLAAAANMTIGHAGIAIMKEAARRSIPCRRLPRDPQRLLLGQGCKLQRFHRGYTDQTGFLGSKIATNKYLAALMFRSHGLPAPRNAVARDEAALRSIADSLGFPLVVKPNEGDFGTAVTLQIEDRESLERAYALAHEHGDVLVEQQVAGDNHRLLVMHDKVVSAVRQRPAHVLGDGAASIATLIDRENANRTDELSEQMKRITVDEELHAVLASQGLSLDSRPAAEQEVLLRRHSNLSRGGTNVNVTDLVHPDNRAMAERAARVVGLDVAGVDFITTDVSRPFYEIGGGICEINPMPGWIMGDGPDLASTLLDHDFPPGDQGRIPMVAVLGGARAVRIAETAAALLAGGGRVIGLATSEKLMVRDHCVARGDYSAETGGCLLLADPAVEAGVQALTVGRVVEQGFGFDRCTAAVLAGPEDAPSSDAELRSRVAAMLAAVALGFVVVPAGDPDRGALLQAAGKAQVCLVSGDPDDPAIRDHCAAGERALLSVRDGDDASVTLWRGGEPSQLCKVPAAGLDDEALVDLACAIAAALSGGLKAGALQVSVGQVDLTGLVAQRDR